MRQQQNQGNRSSRYQQRDVRGQDQSFNSPRSADRYADSYGYSETQQPRGSSSGRDSQHEPQFTDRSYQGQDSVGSSYDRDFRDQERHASGMNEEYGSTDSSRASQYGQRETSHIGSSNLGYSQYAGRREPSHIGSSMQPSRGSQGEFSSRGDLGSQTRGELGSHYGAQQDYTGRMAKNHSGLGPKGYKRSDDRIKEDVCECLFHDAHIDASGIEVEVKDVTNNIKVEATTSGDRTSMSSERSSSSMNSGSSKDSKKLSN